MDLQKSNPNVTDKLRRFTGVVLIGLGALGVLGCSGEQADEAPVPEDATTIVDKSDCIISSTNVGLMSNTERTVEDFAESYVQHQGEIAGLDLSQCVDEVIDGIINTPDNRMIGAATPNSEVHTVWVPKNISLRP